MTSNTPFNDPRLRDWFFSRIDPPSELHADSVVVEGSGPFEREEFIQFLVRNGGDPVRISDGVTSEIVILGEFGWPPEDLAAFVQRRAGQRVRVYSQEMFLLYWASDVEPFAEADEETLERFREGHPGLSALPDMLPDFDWPTTSVRDAPSTTAWEYTELEDSPSPGMLYIAGYHTGQKAKPGPQRRETLRRLFLSKDLRLDYPVSEIGLSGARLEKYIDAWGKGASALRLRRMATTIASLSRMEKRRGLDLSPRQRDEDLAWLKREFYDGKFDGRDDWWGTLRA